jgi:hypothetical protein
MAVLMMLELPGATPEQYDRANEILGIAGDEDAPDGLISHAAGLTDEGMVIVDVWDSAESLERFFEERSVADAMKQAGAEPGEPRVLPVHNQFEGGGSEPAVLMIAEIDDFGTDTYDQMTAGMEGHGTPRSSRRPPCRGRRRQRRHGDRRHLGVARGVRPIRRGVDRTCGGGGRDGAVRAQVRAHPPAHQGAVRLTGGSILAA